MATRTLPDTREIAAALVESRRVLEEWSVPVPASRPARSSRRSPRPTVRRPRRRGAVSTVLVVDDDEEIVGLLERHLAGEGFTVVSAATPEDAVARAIESSPDLILLDIVLGDRDGREVLTEVRLFSDVPVIFLTGRGLESDRIVGLRMGADDYIVKPFSLGELSARIETVLRRSATVVDRTVETATRRYGDLTINETTHEATRHGQLVDLTAKEFALLAFLAAHPRQVFSREQLLRQVWESSAEWQTDATVTEHIRRLRGKIEDDPDHPGWIVTVRGAGYRFEPGSSRRPPAH